MAQAIFFSLDTAGVSVFKPFQLIRWSKLLFLHVMVMIENVCFISLLVLGVMLVVHYIASCIITSVTFYVIELKSITFFCCTNTTAL